MMITYTNDGGPCSAPETLKKKECKRGTHTNEYLQETKQREYVSNTFV